jgi:hypothetical protein
MGWRIKYDWKKETDVLLPKEQRAKRKKYRAEANGLAHRPQIPQALYHTRTLLATHMTRNAGHMTRHGAHAGLIYMANRANTNIYG